MNFYLFLTLFVGVLPFFRFKKLRPPLGYLLVFFLFIIAAFRAEYVGEDTEDYLSLSSIAKRAYFADISNMSFTDIGSSVELVNNFVCKIIIDFGLDSRFILVFYSFVMILFVFLAFKKLNVNIVYGFSFFVILELFFYSLSACRQMCAVGVLMYAYSCLYEKKTYKFFIYTLVATLIHSFSIFSFFIYFVKYIPPLSRKISIIIYVLSILLLFLRIDFINYLSIYLNFDHVTSYVDNYGDIVDRTVLSYITRSIHITFLFYCYKAVTTNSSLSTIKNIFLISIVLYAFLSNYAGILSRILFNFSVVQCAVLSLAFQNSEKMKSLNGIAFYSLFLLIHIVWNSHYIVSLNSNYSLMNF